MISVIDCGMGNIGSVVNILKHIGAQVEVISSSEEVLKATKLLFPGVGHWDNGVAKLNQSGLREALNIAVLENKTPILGICLGMQLLFKSSEEGQQEGLGWIPGKISKFDFKKINSLLNDKKLRIPHMGWNIITPCIEHSIFNNFSNDPRFYFVHSFHASGVPNENKLMTSQYGYEFVCAVHKDNIWGVQFHPEKSHKFGMTLLKNFVENI